MLALEHPHRQQPLALLSEMESAFRDPYLNQSMNPYGSFDSTASFASMGFPFCGSSFLSSEVPADTSNFATFASCPDRLFNPPSPHSELRPPSLSNASAASIPSKNPSTVGSPYSATAQVASGQKAWTGSSHGLDLGPTVINHDGFDQGFQGVDLDSEMRFGIRSKAAEDFVGEYIKPSPSQNTSSNSAFSKQPQFFHSSPFPTAGKGCIEGGCVTVDAALGQADRAVTPGLFRLSRSRRSFTQFLSTPKENLGSRSQQSKIVSQPSPVPAPSISKIPVFSKPCFSSAKSGVASHSGKLPMNMSSFDITAESSGSDPTGRIQTCSSIRSSGNLIPPLQLSYPSLIQPTTAPYPDVSVAYQDHTMYSAPAFSVDSTAASPPTVHQDQVSQGFAIARTSPEMAPQIFYNNYQHAPCLQRQASVSSQNSRQSLQTSTSGTVDFDADAQEKGRCPHPDCGRVFKDLKAHMLTHQSERPEKCPILTCEYNQKGFARKYDKNRHTLTHYKGTMVCGFCPGSGSAAEKSFNRADVFKRHLTSVHGVEQTPPNSRRRSPAGSNRKAASYCQDATGKCSTCSATFNNAQDFYEHLDDCVLRVVQQEEPSEAINQQHLADVATDDAVKATMERHMLTNPDEALPLPVDDDEDDEDEDEDEDNDDDGDPSYKSRSGKGMITSKKTTSVPRAVINGGISKSTRAARRGLTFSKGGVALVSKGRKKRKHYPASWGVSADKMKMKKRVLCVYDGERRLWKDDMMLNSEFEVRMNMADGNSYITDLDVETLKRADALHGATEEERGPWVEEIPAFNLEELMS